MSSDADGSRSLGFRTNAFPHAIATGNIHIGTIAGKLNGVIPATTPSGWRIEWTSVPVDTDSEYPPFSRCGIPHANSTTSWPAPDLAERVATATLPCSALIAAASSSLRRSSASRNAKRIRTRRDERDVTPLRERLARALHRGVDLRRPGQRDLRLHRARRRVEDVTRALPVRRPRACRRSSAARCASRRPFAARSGGQVALLSRRSRR